MSKKDYTIEMQDAFGSDQDPKDLIKMGKKIKSLQKKALPTSKFVKDLAIKLQVTHELDTSEDIPPRFTVFQIFGAVCSFIFISGAILSVYTMKLDSDEVLLWEKIHSTSVIQKSIWTQFQAMELAGEGEWVSQENESFIDICSKNFGTVSEDGDECIFQDGQTCDRDTIYPESSFPCAALYEEEENTLYFDESEGDVWERIENLGQ